MLPAIKLGRFYFAVNATVSTAKAQYIISNLAANPKGPFNDFIGEIGIASSRYPYSADNGRILRHIGSGHAIHPLDIACSLPHVGSDLGWRNIKKLDKIFFDQMFVPVKLEIFWEHKHSLTVEQFMQIAEYCTAKRVDVWLQMTGATFHANGGDYLGVFRGMKSLRNFRKTKKLIDKIAQYEESKHE